MGLLEKLAKKFILPVAVAGSFLLPNSSFSEEKKSDFAPSNYMCSRLGFYFDGDKE